jgi:hypothetical protein
MSLRTLSVVFALCLALSGCVGSRLGELNNSLNHLSNPPQPAALATLAREAEAEAKKAVDPKDRAGFYRIAAVAAWQTGKAGNSLVFSVSDAGIATCEGLPNQDQAAPRDCSLIRLAAPLAVQDDLARDLAQFQGKLKQLEDTHHQRCGALAGDERARCLAARAKLPAADLSPVQSLFGGFETQFEKVSTIRSRLTNLDVDDTFRRKTDRQRVIIFCNAMKAWSLSADVEGASMSSFTAMAGRKKAMEDRLHSDSLTSDCRDLATAQTAKWDE